MAKNKIYISLLIIFFTIFSCSDSEVFISDGLFINYRNEDVGTVELTQQGNGSNIRISIKGLIPGKYSLDFYEIGKCNSPDFEASGSKIKFFDRENLYTFYVKKEINRYTGKVKDFNQTLFIERIILDPKVEQSLSDFNGSSFILSDELGKKIICSEIYLR